MNKTADWTLLVGRLALIVLYTTSAIGKFGALDQTASMIGGKDCRFRRRWHWSLPRPN